MHVYSWRSRHLQPTWTRQILNHPLRVSMMSEGLLDLRATTLSPTQLQELQEQRYLIVPNFLSPIFAEAIRQDMQALRKSSQFRQAKIGQDATNALNTEIRVAETCFIGPDKLDFNRQHPNAARKELYSVLDTVRQSLMDATQVPLDASLSELLYAYYPNGGYYRTHVDAMPGSASFLRQYSLLLYVNDETWDVAKDGGSLRLYLNQEEENHSTLDVSPTGGTLVLFQSDAIPHEVLDTTRERCVVVGWYNRPFRAADAALIAPSGDVTTVRLALMAVAVALVSVGLVQLLN
jgi:SM-20-related protein